MPEETIEEVRDIFGFDGDYQITTFGRVKSVKSSIFLSQKIDKDGYREVGLWKRGQVSFRKVHQLVALAFIPNPLSKTQVNHLDFDRANNRKENLVWATMQEDADHRSAHGRFPKGESHYCYGKFGKDHKSAKRVLDTQTNTYYLCVQDAADAVGIRYKTLVGKLNGRDKNNTTLIYA